MTDSQEVSSRTNRPELLLARANAVEVAMDQLLDVPSFLRRMIEKGDKQGGKKHHQSSHCKRKSIDGSVSGQSPFNIIKRIGQIAWNQSAGQTVITASSFHPEYVQLVQNLHEACKVHGYVYCPFRAIYEALRHVLGGGCCYVNCLSYLDISALFYCAPSCTVRMLFISGLLHLDYQSSQNNSDPHKCRDLDADDND